MKHYTIKNDFISLTILEYGATIQKLLVKDKNGKQVNVVAGHDQPEAYLEDHISLGACVGRYAGRISKGGFNLEGTFFPLYNENGIHLHGGEEGFGQKYWTLKEHRSGKQPFLQLAYESAHLEEGYPGNLSATVTYTLVGSTLKILFEATTDKTTVVNLTNHAYYRLDNEDSIEHYQLELKCNSILDVDGQLVPTGRFNEVLNTQYDFSKKKQIGKVHLDTPFTFTPNCKNAAQVSSKVSGIIMKVTTDQPAIVIYTPTSFPAICFETQNYPDAPNHSHFPTSVLRPGELYRNESSFSFETL
ncbi:aldose epimerase family protein [Sediminicola sp. 1XM1-17]|uniref:aldose epimerase family protein n=1 Tax=Sediminicola sp. 1XM1-17 TaxID=3127702 RepID=UPI003077BF4B